MKNGQVGEFKKNVKEYKPSSMSIEVLVPFVTFNMNYVAPYSK